MASTIEDFKLASAAAGFTLGFSVLCVWNAVRQTMSIRSPLRSVYIYMVWGEIAANIGIGILGWMFLDGTIKLGVPILFSLLFLWVFEVQLLMQIIINRIAVVVDDRRLIRKLKWGTAAIITCINIAVFVIWIPSHLSPPPIPVFVEINKYWDRISKVLILFVDAGLNYFFLRTVKHRLVNYHGLTKYAPLVSFNARLMVISILMDVLLLGLMSLKNQVVYVQFHPVAYMVKLNIEMSMASLITKLAKSSVADRNNEFNIDSSTHGRSHAGTHPRHSICMKSGVHTSAVGKMRSQVDKDFGHDFEGIRTFKEVAVTIENAPDEFHRSGSSSEVDDGFDKRRNRTMMRDSDDELPLSVTTEAPKKPQNW